MESIEVRNYARKLKSTPPVPCEFKVGQKVAYKNEFGVVFNGMTIIGFSEDDNFYGRFIHLRGAEHDGAYWFPHKPEELTAE